MKKHCWEIRSSPHEVKVFFRNPTLNSHFKSRFFLVLPTVHPVDGWVSLEERFVKSTVARKKCFLYLMFSFLISQSQLIYYPNELCSLRQFHFSVSPTKQCSQSNQYCQRMQFDWYLGFSESRTCIFVSHKFPQKPQLKFVAKSTTSSQTEYDGACVCECGMHSSIKLSL